MSNQNQIATVEKTAGDFLKNFQQTLPTYAIKEYKQETFVKSAMIAIMGSDELQKCLKSDTGKASVVNAMRMAAGTGLSLNPQEGKAALIAYSGKASYQVMKNGLIELALESGKVDFITADTVRSADDFSMSKTMNGDEYSFSPSRKSRGEIDGFFAAIKMTDGICHTKYMTAEECTAHRGQFSKRTQMPEEGYGQKTVLKKLLNNLHISSDLANAIGADAHREEVVDITPPPEKGTSADELTQKLANKTTTAEPEPETVEAEVVKEEPAKKGDSVI